MPKTSRRPPPARPLPAWGLALIAAAALGLAGLGAWRAGLWPAGLFGPTPTPILPTLEPRYDGVDYCQGRPKFLSDLQLGPSPVVGTSLRGHLGFTVYDRNGSGQVYQQETWDDAGNLGAFVRDANGNIYAVPVPLVDLQINPPEKQVVLARIDSATGILAPWLTLPAAAPPNANNPFGLLGLTLDCETNSLYVTSVAGSTAGEEMGRLYRVDLTTGTVAAELDGVDAMGVGVFAGAGGKRLYFGSARTPRVLSVALDAAGNFTGEVRPEFLLTDIAGVGNQRARRLTFAQPKQLVMFTTEFSYSLRAQSDPRANLVTLRYDPASDTWTAVDVQTSSGDQ